MAILKIFSDKNNELHLQKLFDKIESLLDLARQLYTQSEELKKVVESEKASVQQSSSASHEISSMVSTTADAASELSHTAQESNQSVNSSVNALNELNDLIDVVNETSQFLQNSVKNGLKEIASVTETMTEIQSKANMINEIVFQTKLLSFNASIEAARAGEQGKGFAVVAEEMGTLALASGKAAKEIENILVTSVERTKKQIENVTHELEKVAQNTVNSISDVSKKTKEISSSFSQLEHNSKKTETKSQEISHATHEQRIGVEEISKSLQNLELNSQKLDRMATEGNKSAADLSSSIENITSEFSELAKILGYKITKIEKPFDFNAAIKAHIDWKMKLSKYLENPDGSLDHQKVCLDNACALGKWIYGDGQNHRDLNTRLFDQVKNSHAQFHQAAGEIIKLANSEQKEKAKLLLSPSGNYLKISEATVELIKKLQIEVETRSLKPTG